MPTKSPDAASRLAFLSLQAMEENKGETGYTDTLESYIRSVCPSFPWTRHTRRLVSILQRVADGDLPPRVIIQLPPRHYKSTTVSRLFSGWWLRRNPRQFVGIGSYGANLAVGFSRAARGYFVASGGLLDQASAAANEWGTAGGMGGMWATGVDGAGTGKGFHLGIVDDPHKDRKDAESPTMRQRVKDWWDSVFYTRQEPGAVIIVIQTRWHADDLVGYLLEKEQALIDAGTPDLAEGWHVVDLPAIAPPANSIRPFPRSCTVEPDTREPGEALDPERISLKSLERTRATLTTRDWEALYQQSPTVEAGSVFFRKWLRYHAPEGEGQDGDAVTPSSFIRLILSVDASFKDTSSSDHVAMLLWGQAAQGMFLLHIVNQRMGFTDTAGSIRLLHQARPFGELLIEDKANGSAVVDTLKRESRGFIIREVNPLGGKVARANACTLEFEQGRVFIPRNHPELAAYEKQLLGFPSLDADDMVDSTTQLLNYVCGVGPMRVSTVEWGFGADLGPTPPATPTTGHGERRILAGMPALPDPDDEALYG